MSQQSIARRRARVLAAAVLALPAVGSSASLAVTVGETISSSSGQFLEGDTYDISVDILPGQSHETYTWDLSLDTATVFNGSGNPATLSGLVIEQNGTFPWSIYGSVYDESTGNTEFNGSGTFDVHNVAPTITGASLYTNTLSDDGSSIMVDEGEPVYARMTSDDPGNDSHSYDISVDGTSYGTSFSGYLTGPRSSDEVYVGQPQDGSYTVSFSAFDGDDYDGGNVTRTLIVQNVAPALQDFPNDSEINLDDGTIYGFGASATDAGIYDILSYNWDLDGDGVFGDAFDANVAYNYDGFAPGIYQLSVMVSDDGGGSDLRTFNLTILPEPTSLGALAVAGAGVLLTRRGRPRNA